MQKDKVMLINEFVESYMEKLFYFCLKKTGNSFEAEDLTQDIALQIISALNKGTMPTSFSGWIWSIARNRYCLWAKAKRRRNESIAISDVNDLEIEDESETTLDEIIHAEQLALLGRELAFIKSDYRKIVVAYYIEHKSIEDIASSLSLPENTVKSKLFRARKILKEGMEMAREFGKRSYNPDEITYTNVCTRPGELGQPWTLLDPKLNQNIFLACYDNPMSPEELAIEAIAENLVEYGYAYKKDGEYIPRVAVISKKISDEFIKYSKKKNHTAQFNNHTERQRTIHEDLMLLFNNINQNVREILIEDLPTCISSNLTMLDALLGSICTTSHTLGYLIKHALKSGWLKYDESTTPAIGAHFVI